MMRRFDASSAECLVFTYREGLLSAVAHNLKIRVTRFVIEVDETTRVIEARFDAGSLRVVCAMEDGVEDLRALTKDDKREIEGNIVRDVIHAREHPEIRFVSSAVKEKSAGYTVTGRLALHGKERRIVVSVEEQDGRYVAEAKIHQPDFGIRPYRALLGTLKVKADVIVRVAVPTAGM